jgi:hypothetical protein
MVRSRAVDVAAAVGLALAAIAVWKLRIVDTATEPLQMLGNADFYMQIHPMSHRAAAWWRSGIVPLWNPYQYAGQPFLAAAIYGVLYPPNAWYLVLPTAWAIEAVLVTHLIAAGVFTYAYARVLRLARPAAAIAALTYMLSGYVLSLVSWFPPALAAATWLPLALLAVERLVERPGAAWSCVLALALALPFVAGWPQTWLYAVYASGLYALVRMLGVARMESGPTLARTALWLAFGVVASVGLMAVQFLPTHELQSLGPRQSGRLSLSQILLAPIPLDTLAHDLLDVSPRQPRPSYVGVAPLLLAGLAILRTSGTAGARALCFAGIGLVAIGSAANIPVLSAIYQSLPGLMRFRRPARVLVLWSFAIAMLAGLGAHALARPVDRGRTLASYLYVAVLVVAALVAWPSAGVSLHLALGLVLLLLGLIAGRRGSPVVLAALVVLVVWDLAGAARNGWMHPFQNLELFDRERALLEYVEAHQGLDRTYLKPDLVPGVSNRPGRDDFKVATMPKQGTLRGIYSITDYEPLSLDRYGRFYARMSRPPPAGQVFTGQLLADPARPEFRMLDLLSVRFMAVVQDDVETLRALGRRADDWRPVSAPLPGRFALFERSNVLPRAYVAFDARPVRDEAEALAAVSTPDFEPRRTVVLEDAGAATPAPSAAPIASARIVAYEPTRVVIEAETPARGHLVLTDTFYPGWEASVDGAAQPIVRANYLFRAVALEPGAHVVTFTYAPASFRIGAALSSATLLALLLIVARARTRRS